MKNTNPYAYLTCHTKSRAVRKEGIVYELPQVGRKISVQLSKVHKNEHTKIVEGVVQKHYSAITLVEVNAKKERYKTSFISEDFRNGAISYCYVD